MTRILQIERKKTAAAGAQRDLLMRWRWRVPLFLCGLLVTAAALAAFRLEPTRLNRMAANAVLGIIGATKTVAVGANQVSPSAQSGRERR